MNVVWDCSLIMVGEVFFVLLNDKVWVQKMVNMFFVWFVEKGVLGVIKDGKVNVYCLLFVCEDCVGVESDLFFQCVF